MQKLTLINADVLAGLRGLPDASVQCCVTSPPYWGLRDYGVAGQIGLESNPDAYVARLVDVFREVRRVLADDGTLWLNLGDSYAAQRGATSMPAQTVAGGVNGKSQDLDAFRGMNAGKSAHRDAAAIGLKHKDLVGIPWRVAFALQADGWYLRQDIIWHKPNPMPESVTDRCTKAHEYIFLLSKSARYYYDAEAVAENFADERMGNPNGGGQYAKNCPYPNSHKGQQSGLAKGEWNTDGSKTGRNRRSVWTITTKPYSEAHFATFPPELPELCIRAGSKAGDTILDPFSGAGTTGLVALRLGRKYIGIELNPAYVEMSRARIEGDMPLLMEAPA